jgi:hypothetical protein
MEIPLYSNTCWILGAGASYDCIGPDRVCVPITRDLINLSVFSNPELDQLSSLLELNPKKNGERLAEIIGPRLENTFDLLRKRIDESKRKTRKSANEMLKTLTDKVANQIKLTQTEATLSHGGTRGFEYCAENYLWLASRSCHNPGWSIVTLNYDTILDRAFEELAVRGVEVQLYSKWLSLLNDYYDKIGREYIASGYYLKLHGSMDIYYCMKPSCSYYRRPFTIRPQVSLGSTLLETIYAHDIMCKKCKSKAYEFILPPGKNKIEPEWEYHQLTYAMAEKILQRANSWVIVGYSCPKYDYDIIELLKLGLSYPPEDPDLPREIMVVSPDAKEIAQRLENAFNHPVIANTLTFSQFIDRLLNLEGANRPGLA